MTNTKLGATLTALFILATPIVNAADLPDFTGTWNTYRGSPGAAPSPASQPLLKAEALAAVADYSSIIEGTNYGAGNACVGYGLPESLLGSGGGYPMEIIQRPEQVFMINELQNEIRRFYIGEEAGDPADFFPERNGYSIAHWEGERLIVDTTRLKTQVDTRYPHSNQTTIHEEYYLDDPLPDGTRILVVEMVMNDPLWLEEPFKATKRWQELDQYHVLTYECTEPKWLDDMEMLYRDANLEMIQE